MRLSILALLLRALALSACYVEPGVDVGADIGWIDTPPYYYEAYPRVYFHGYPAYYIGGRWYWNHDGRWGVFRSEPPALYHYRRYGVPGPARPGPVYRAPPAYRAPGPVYRAPHR